MMEAKIFINTDEEISFITEKINDVTEKNIALVVPDRALLLSSLPSLKLLKKQMIKQGKKVIIVSMDEGGRKLAKQAGITTVPRVTELKPQMWEDENSYSFDASNLKKSSLLKKEENKHEIIEGIDEKTDDVSNADLEPQNSIESKDPIEENQISHTYIPPVILPPSEVIVPNELPIAEEEVIETLPNEEVEFHQVKTLPEMPDSENDGIDFVVGQDINEFKKNTKLKSENILPRSSALSQPKVEEDVISPQTHNKDVLKLKTISLLSYMTVMKNNLISKLKKPSLNGNKKLPIIIISILIFLLLSTGAYAYYLAPKANVVVVAAIAPISLSQIIYVSPNNKLVITTGDKILVPSYSLSSSPQTASLDAPTTGSKITGKNATGQIEVMNISTSNDVNVKKGSSIFTCRTGGCSGLTYMANDNATLPRQMSGKTTSTATVNVTATDIGDKYNFTFPTINTFDLSGFEIYTVNRNIDSFSGGSTQTIKIVSQSDIDNLKKQLISQIKDNTVNDLKSGSTGDNTLIDSTIGSAITDQKIDSPAGSSADRVNVSITMTATAQGFKKSDLQTVTNQLVKSNQKTGFAIDNQSISFIPTIQDKVSDGQKVLLAIKAVQKPVYDNNEIKNAIKGKSVADTQKYLNQLAGQTMVKVDLSPAWVPGFLKHMPFSSSNINLNLDIK